MTTEIMPTTDAAQPHEPPHRNDWRVLLVLFTLAGVVESQAFGHLQAFTPLYLQQLHVPLAQVPTWTGILAALQFVIGLPLLPFWGICSSLSHSAHCPRGDLPRLRPIA